VRLCTDKTSSAGGGVITESDETNNCGTPWTDVTVACTGSDRWDSMNSACADPQVISAVVDGELYPPGTITLTCDNTDTDSYAVYYNDSIFVATTSYSGPVVIGGITSEGNYVIRCAHGNIYDQVTRYYDATPGTPDVTLNVTPPSIVIGEPATG
jgi:hypothetical protein